MFRPLLWAIFTLFKTYEPPPKVLGYKKYSENHTYPEATVTMVLLIYYSIFLNINVNQAHYRPEMPRGLQEVKVPRFRDNGRGWWLVVGCQPYAPAAFTPRKYSWYSFLLEAESTPGP